MKSALEEYHKAVRTSLSDKAIGVVFPFYYFIKKETNRELYLSYLTNETLCAPSQKKIPTQNLGVSSLDSLRGSLEGIARASVLGIFFSLGYNYSALSPHYTPNYTPSLERMIATTITPISMVVYDHREKLSSVIEDYIK